MLYSEPELKLLCQHIERVRSQARDIQVLPVACDMKQGHDLLIEFAHDHLVILTYELKDAGNGKQLEVKRSTDLDVLCVEGVPMQLDVGSYKRTREFGLGIYKAFS